MNPEVTAYFRKAKKWREEMEQLRSIVLRYDLIEEMKWRVPCYAYEGGNVLLINQFKDSCVLSFFKGSLLRDKQGLLEKPGANSQSARVIRFSSIDEIIETQSVLSAYVEEAIAIEKDGLKVTLKKPEELVLVEELQHILAGNRGFKEAFAALTPGRQRGYNLHFSGAKQSATRTSRVEKCMPRIMDGYGLNDCICGLSKRMPECDGSHKTLT